VHEDPQLVEYYKIVDIVGDFDKRLLTVKSWGVTLSLAALGLAFQFEASGYFLVAAASALAFWGIEGSMKSHQMRYYPRMREIEVARAKLGEPGTSSPRIDWSWSRARLQLLGKVSAESGAPTLRDRSPGYRHRYFGATVLLPHLVAAILGLGLFVLAHLKITLW